ncbi:MAG: sugar kinase [Anaerolineaceae bacterium]|nr:MAG: sugar kinase [Anaerolineaceae bacterium]
MPDLITIGETMVAFTPEGGIPIHEAPPFHMHIAGAESNTAIGIARLGHSSGWISRLGDDSFGNYILQTINSESVDTSRTVLDSTHVTGVMFKQPSNENETTVCYYRENSAATYLSTADLDIDYLKSAKILHITGITPILSDSCNEYIQASIHTAHENGILISFDPNIRRKLWENNDYRPRLNNIVNYSDIVLLGLSEANFLYGTSNINTILQNIFSNNQVRYVAIKNGSKGAWVCTRDERHFIEPIPCISVDPVGAGDGFNAGFLHGVLDDKDIRTCGIYGGIVGAMATETYGDIDGYPTYERLKEMQKKHNIY